MTAGAGDGIAALRRSHDDLVSFVEKADPAALDATSGSSEWSVADVLSHLGSAAEIGFGTLTTRKADMAAAPAIWDRWNAMSPAEKAANFVTAGERLVEAFEALDDDAVANGNVDVGFLPAPVSIGFFAAMRLSEVGLHSWDIAVAFDPNATVPNYIVPFMLEQLPLFAGFFAKPIGRAGSIAIETSEPAQSYVLQLSDSGASLSEGERAEAGTRAQMSAEAFVRLTGGRLAPEHTPAAVAVTGDLSLDDVRRIFPGY